jgi:hypothetical protein
VDLCFFTITNDLTLLADLTADLAVLETFGLTAAAFTVAGVTAAALCAKATSRPGGKLAKPERFFDTSAYTTVPFNMFA